MRILYSLLPSHDLEVDHPSQYPTTRLSLSSPRGIAGQNIPIVRALELVPEHDGDLARADTQKLSPSTEANLLQWTF